MKSDKRRGRFFQIISWAIPVLMLLLAGYRLMIGDVNQVGPADVNLWAARFTLDGKTLATAAGLGDPNDLATHGECTLWDVASKTEKFVLMEDSAVRSVACSPDGQRVAVGEFNGLVKLIDPATGRIVGTLTNSDAVNAVAFSPDNRLLACAVLAGKVTVWTLATQQPQDIAVPDETVINVAICPNGRLLGASTRSGNAYIIDIAHPASPLKVEAYAGPPMTEPNVEAVAFSPDGTRLATGSQTCLRLWEATSGKLLNKLDGCTANVNSAAFSPDGKVLATVDADGWLSLWDPATGNRKQSIQAHSGTSFSVDFSPDGTRIATIGRDENNVKIWDAKTLDQVATLTRNPKFGLKQR